MDLINVKSLLDEIKNEFGEENIKSGLVTKHLGPKHYKALIKYGKKVGAGLYSLDELEEVPEDETKTTPTEISNKITDFIHVDSLIPTIDDTYIVHGCYTTIHRVVKNNTFLPIYIVGESGNGKTMGVEQACANSGRELVCFNITNETSEEDLIGSFILDNGDMLWKDGPVLVAMRRGAVLLLDEIDQATTNIMCLQTVLQNKPYYVKKTNEMVYPKKGFTVVATANTKGNGDGGDRFMGANVLNEAFLERFNIVVEQDYPKPKVESAILKKVCDDHEFIIHLVRWANMIRENYKINTIERCITTRRLVQIIKNYEVFKDKKASITYALNRFDTPIKEAMLDYYDSINNAQFNDDLEKHVMSL